MTYPSDGPRKYRLKRDMPGFPAGTIFEHRERDERRDIGSIGAGYLTNIWVDHNCQRGANGHLGWVEGTHILPGQMKDDAAWFEPVIEEAPAKMFSVGDMVYFRKGLDVSGAFSWRPLLVKGSRSVHGITEYELLNDEGDGTYAAAHLLRYVGTCWAAVQGGEMPS